MSLDNIMELIENNSVRLVRFLYCDTSNVIRGKCSGIGGLRTRLETGIGLVKGMMAMNMLDQLQADTGYGATGEVRMVPDPATFKVLPYAPSQAMVLCDLIEIERNPWNLCPRTILKRQIKAAQEEGIRIQASFEPEFFLGRMENGAISPVDRSNCFATDGMNRASAFINDFVSALEAQGLAVEQYYPELGHGQHELSIRHAPALEAADNQIIYRETLRGLAHQHGLVASLTPKPGLDMPGNGAHLHLSAWQATSNRNLFLSENAVFSETGQQFVAGILKHLPAVLAFTCSSVNSYRRLKPKSWSSAYVCWGYENREAAVRVPSLYWGQESESANIEVKCVDSSSNPYLALATVIAAGLEGIKQKLVPPKPVQVDPSTLSAEEAEQRQIRRLPVSLKESLENLKLDPLVINTVGPEFTKVFLAVKSSEESHFAGCSPEDEIKEHLIRY